MLSLRYFYVLALVIWLGGMAVAGFVVAPAIFGELEAWNPAMGRILAGRVFGAVLRRLYTVAYVAGAVMFFVLTLQRVLGPRPRSYGIRVGLITLMLGFTAYAGLRISPRIDTLQQQVNGPMNQLGADDPRRVEFDRLHTLATTLMTAAIVSGLVLVGWEARE